MDKMAEKAKGVALGFGLFVLLAWPFLALMVTLSMSR